MVDVSKLNEGNILLVGEGNFSFTISLLNKLATKSTKNVLPVKVITTCFQKYKDLSGSIQENAKLACKLGAEVWFGIDGTTLHLHEKFRNESFDHIIFNFPHVGGKMKLHLNRLLLKNFFTSASHLLKVKGKISVTLCQGQSGTPYDFIKRKQGDTWQIIEMAAYADLVLCQAHPFYCDDWPLYNSNGYRGLEKGFHLKGAYTFVFTKLPLIVEIKSIKQEEFNNLHCPYVQSLLDRHADTARVFPEVQLFLDYFKTKQKNLKICDTVHTICLCQEKADGINWWEHKLLTEERHFDANCYLLCQSCYVGNFEPVRKLITFNASSREGVALLLNFLDLRCHRIESTKNELEQWAISHYEVDRDFKVATIFENGDDIILCIYVQYFINLVTNFALPQQPFPFNYDVTIKSLHPPAHCHDLCFWITNEFSLKRFACALRHAAGHIIRSFTLIDEYYCPIKQQKSLCYRIVYQSFCGALSSDKAFHLQTKIIGPFLEECLNVIIR